MLKVSVNDCLQQFQAYKNTLQTFVKCRQNCFSMIHNDSMIYWITSMQGLRYRGGWGSFSHHGIWGFRRETDSLLLKVIRSRNKNCRAVTSPKNKRTNLFFYPDNLEILKTWIIIFSYKYFQVIRIEKQIHPFICWEKLWLDNFVSRSTGL